MTRTPQPQTDQQSSSFLAAQTASIISLTAAAIVTADAAGQIVEWNPGAERLFGHTAADIIGQPLTRLMPERYRALHNAGMERWRQGEPSPVLSGVVELEGLHRDGHVFPVELAITSWQHGRKRFFTGILQATAARKQAERTIFQLKTSLELSNEGVLMFRPDTLRFFYANPAACRQVGRSEADLLTLHPYDLNPEYPEATYRELIAPLLSGSQSTLRFETRQRHQDGHDIPVEVLLQLMAPPGEPAWLVNVVRDITARKALEQSLLEAVSQLEASNAELAEFAYAASHDLKEPLRAISGCVQILQRQYGDQLEPSARDLISHAVEGAARMQNLIEDLLAYASLSQRKAHLEPINMEIVLAETVQNLRAAIDDSAAQITHDALPTVPGEKSQLIQLMQNLLANAIKFRGDRQPQIHISAQRQPPGWQFSVRDNGIGIAPGFFERVFVLFQRLHGRGEYPGTGIGLAICRKIVERHGGRIWVDSVPGQGTTFFFTLAGG